MCVCVFGHVYSGEMRVELGKVSCFQLSISDG